jgi:glycosyltransferase involved in cell wall biosynthesis
MKVAVLIPCYNEEITIKKVINDFRKELPDADIYVYNNNSSDKSYDIAMKENVIVKNEYRQGKGNVVRSMFRDIDADVYVMVDADDTYEASDVHKLMEPVINGQADMTVGDRLSKGLYQEENKRNFHVFGNNLVKWMINKLFSVRLNDIMSGYRCFNKIFVKNIPVMSRKFELETEMTLHALDKNYIIKEIPITYRDRPAGSVSKLNTISDGAKVLKTIIKVFKDYSPRKFFYSAAMASFVLGLAVGLPVIIEFIETSKIDRLPSAVLAAALMTISVVSIVSGTILDTIVKKDKEAYELNIQRYLQLEKNYLISNNID